MGEPQESSAEAFRLLFESHPYPTWVFERQTHAFLAVNDAALVKYGYVREAFLALGLADIFQAPDVSPFLEALSAADATAGDAGVWRHRLRDGQSIEVEVTYRPVRFAGRNAALLVALDITARRQLAHELRLREERASKIFHISPSAITLTTLHDGRFIDVNASALQLLGFEREEVIGHTAVELGLWTTEARDGIIQQLATQGAIRNAEIELQNKAGEYRSIYGSVELLEIDGEKLLLMSGVDITKRKQAEMIGQQLTRRLQTLLEIDQAILMAQAPISIAQGALRQIRRLVPSLGGAIMLIDRDRQEAELFFADENSNLSLQTGARFSHAGNGSAAPCDRGAAAR